MGQKRLKFHLPGIAGLLAISALQLHASAVTIVENNASYNYNIPQTPGGAVTANISGNVFRGPGESDITLTIWLISTGSGDGSLAYNVGVNADGSQANFNASYQVDTITGGGACQGGCNANGNLPIELGTPFELVLQGYAQASTSNGDAGYSGFLNVSAFSLDPNAPAVTLLPYDPTAVPEPATSALFILGLVAVISVPALRRRIRTSAS